MSMFVTSIRPCRVCGGTAEECSGCVERTVSPCWWVAADRCSACVGVPPGRIRRLAARAGLHQGLQAGGEQENL
jgi:hypothetical protein